MREYVCIPYSFEGHNVRVFCRKDGSRGKVVLEDIIQKIYLEDWREQLDNKLKLMEREVAVFPPLADDYSTELHATDTIGIREFYSYCNDSIDQVLYKQFENWLEQVVCSFVEKRMAHLGATIPMLAQWDKFTQNTFEDPDSYGNLDEMLTIDEWINRRYKIDIPWLRFAVNTKIRLQLAMTRRSTAGKAPNKDDVNKNKFSPQEFAFIADQVEKLLSSNDWKWLKESLKKSMNSPSSWNRGNSAVEAADQVRTLITAGKSDDEIIKSIWNTTSSSFPQYQMLKVFLDLVKVRRR
ncbi:hypothetical protein JYQ62_19955 [Nostoc sp. UHCC 0702]|nr:hypothetical protein JYQ62_19955 [Nostoc sp. UHCC 0702]